MTMLDRSLPLVDPGPYAGPADEDDLPFGAEPGYLVRRLHQIATSIFLGQCASLSVTPVQYAAMSAIGKRPGCDQQTVARLTAIDRTTINVVTAKLEERGWLSRSRVGKRIDLTLTREGGAIVDTLKAMTQAHGETLMSPLSATERRQFLGLLEKLVVKNNDLSRVPVSATRNT